MIFAAEYAALDGRPPGTTLYEVVYGSWAHGTNTPSSDVDWRGVYLLPSAEFLGLGRAETTWERKADDRVAWELAHFCRLLLKGNPNIVGMLFAPDDCVLVRHEVMDELIDLRRAFVSSALRSAYMGWIMREAADLAKMKRPPAKRLSHLPRLIWELESALTTGELVVRPNEERREYIRAIKTGAVDLDEALADVGVMILGLEDLDRRSSILPYPPAEAVNSWLLSVRRRLGGPR